jgi:hypothetical protein
MCKMCKTNVRKLRWRLLYKSSTLCDGLKGANHELKWVMGLNLITTLVPRNLVAV